MRKITREKFFPTADWIFITVVCKRFPMSLVDNECQEKKNKHLFIFIFFVYNHKFIGTWNVFGNFRV